MRRHVYLIFLVFCSLSLYSQLPNGSPAPDFDVEDINGNVYSLYAMMGSNKSACIAFEATGCSFCWHFKLSGVLQNVTTNLSAYTTVIFLECDYGTNTECLYGPSGCNSFTFGDWVTGTPYQIADLSPTNGPNIQTEYNRYVTPLLYVISPDKRTWLIGERTYANYASWITQSFALQATPVITHSSCGDNGKVNLNITGGFSFLKYKWSNGATTKDLNNLPGGNYTVTITDANNYFKTFGPYLVEGPTKRVDVTDLDLQHVKCFGEASGKIEVQLDFGTAPYTYKWSNGAQGNANLNLKSGNYILTITDNNQCTRLKNYTINQPSELSMTSVIGQENCDARDGFIQLKGLGGYPPYTYDIGEGEQPNGNFTGLKGGKEYTVALTDQNGCRRSQKVFLEVSHKPVTDAGPDQSIDCINNILDLDGSKSEQQAWYSYQWMTRNGNIVNGSDSLRAKINLPGTYYFKITNTNNKCFSEDSLIVVDQRVFPDIMATGDTVLNCTLIETELKGNSVHPPVKYFWTKAYDSIYLFETNSILIRDSGKYIFHVRDTLNLCEAMDTIVVEADKDLPQVSVQVEKDISCINTEIQLQAVVTPLGNQYRYQWSTANGNIIGNTDIFNPKVSKGGDYFLAVENLINHCQNHTSVHVREQSFPQAGFQEIHQGLNIVFQDESTGIPTSWKWTFGDGNLSFDHQPKHSYLFEGKYEVCLEVENDCGNDRICKEILVSQSLNQSVTLNCPFSKTENACQTQSAIDDKFASWIATSSFSGGCDPVLSNDNQGAPSACGGSSKVTFAVISNCDPPATCSANFTVLPAPFISLYCPSSATEAPCQSQLVIDQKYYDWIDLAMFTGGCQGTLSNDDTGPPSACGGIRTVTFIVTSICESPKTSKSIFTVLPSMVNLQCPSNQTEEAGQTQSEIDIKFANWLSTVYQNGGCKPSLSNDNKGAPPHTGGTTTVTFTVTSDCQPPVSCSALFSVKQMTASKQIEYIKTFELIPNPVSGKGRISIHLDDTRNYSLNIVNILGDTVWSESGFSKSFSHELDFINFAKGVYYVVMRTEQYQSTLKWVVL